MKLQYLMLEKIATFLDFQPTEQQLLEGRLLIDGLSVSVSQLQHSRGSFVAIGAVVADIKACDLGDILSLTMSANHFWRGTSGATFSYNPMTEQLFLALQLTQEETMRLQAHQVGEIFLDLFNTVKHWQAVIRELDLETEQEPLNPQRTYALSFGLAAARLQ